MRRFLTGRLDGPQCRGDLLDPVGEVALGETFVVECVQDETDHVLGPLLINGVVPGDVIAIRIEDIQITEFGAFGPDYGMIPEITDMQLLDNPGRRLSCDNNEILLPGGLRVPLQPMAGVISFTSKCRKPNPWAHGGNMDINETRKGATVYIRAQHEDGRLAVGDLHAYQGDGEIAGSALEADGEVTLTVERSDKYPAPRPVIEIDNRIITVGVGLDYWSAVKTAVRDMTYLLMHVLDVPLWDANSMAVKIGSLRNGAIWMMSDHDEIKSFGPLARTVFLEMPLTHSQNQ